MRLRDSLSGEERELEPGSDGRIGMYVCGPTVYNEIHVGNARPFVVFGLMKRFLEWQGRPVRLVENITDINDKIYAAAKAEGTSSAELADRYARAYVEATDRLGVGRPDVEPLASESIDEIVVLIEQLVERGHAYAAGGDVYYDVRGFDAYGRLSKQRLDALREGARVEPGEAKRDPLDFALWKATKPGEDTAWDSPWGRGRPGWHIECSAMAEKHLGPQFALHGGGRDLVFPHHENELAQSRAAGIPFAQVWAHNGMLTIADEKMSKSVGNIDRLRDVLDRWGAEPLLMLFLQAHYAAPVEYSDDTMRQAQAAAATLRNAFRLPEDPGRRGDGDALRRALVEALEDDFRTPAAMARVFTADLRAADERAAVLEFLEVMGLGGLARDETAVPEELERLAGERDAARGRRDFAAADAIRERIERQGFEVRDTPDGTRIYPRG